MNQEGILEVEENENEENNKSRKIKKKLLFEKELIKSKRNEYKLKTNKFENKKRLNEISNQFACYDLEPEENDLRIETEEIKQLRDEYEDNKKNKSIEPKINKKIKEQIIQRKIDEKNKRKYFGKNINKDHNGKIIFIKSIKLDKLKKDFIIGKTKLKNIIEKSTKKENKINLANKNKINNQNNQIAKEKKMSQKYLKKRLKIQI